MTEPPYSGALCGGRTDANNAGEVKRGSFGKVPRTWDMRTGITGECAPEKGNPHPVASNIGTRQGWGNLTLRGLGKTPPCREIYTLRHLWGCLDRRFAFARRDLVRRD